LRRQNLVLVWIILPSVWVGMVVFLILMSFVSIKVSSIIFVENLILLTILFSPVVYITGTVVSIIASVTPAAPSAQHGESEVKKTAFCAAGLNIVLLVCWLYFYKPFMMELELLS